MFKSKPKPKSAQPPSKPRGVFWITGFKLKAKSQSENQGKSLLEGSGLPASNQIEKQDQSEQDDDSLDLETTISTINIDDISTENTNESERLENDLNGTVKPGFQKELQNINSQKIPLPSDIQSSKPNTGGTKPLTLSSGSGNSIKAWASPLERLSLHTIPVHHTMAEPDENSTEFEIHLADSSQLVQPPSESNFNHEESDKSSIDGQYDFLPKRSQIPRSPFRLKSKMEGNQTAPEVLNTNHGYHFPLQNTSVEKQENPVQLQVVTPLPIPEQKETENSKIDIAKRTASNDSKDANQNRNAVETIAPVENVYQPSIQDIIHEYEARLDFAKQESRNYILDLCQELDEVKKRLSAVEEENETLHQLCSNAESGENIANQKFNELLLEYEKMQEYCDDTDLKFKPLIEENYTLKNTINEMESDLELLSARLDHERNQALKQEADFELFSKKIRSQRIIIADLQDEKDRLQASLRKAQYDPPTKPTEVILQQQLDKALFDIEALKLLIQDLTAENDQLKNGHDQLKNEQQTVESSPNRKSLDTFSKRSTSPSKIPVASDIDKWAIPSESERSAFLRKMQEYEHESRIPSVISPVASQYTNASNSRLRLPSKELRDFVRDNQTSFEGEEQESLIISDKDKYYQRKDTLESALRNLETEKKKLTFELSRIPRNGAKSLRRQNELETMLDNIDREMASIRKQMKDFGLF